MSANRVVVAVGVVALGLAVALSVALCRLTPRLRAEVVRALESRMEATVTLDAFDVALWPRPRVSGGGLVIRHRQRPDLPPLISLRQFWGESSWPGILAGRFNTVEIDGLEITIPPRRGVDMPRLQRAEPGGGDVGGSRSAFGIGLLTATNARLVILPRNPEKDPRVFDISPLWMYDLTLLTPSRFTASLSNPVPAGWIETSGTFGPWNGDEPGETPVGGEFLFDADLGSIKGIAGALHATGAFDGSIDRIAVTGTTETLDFRIPKLKASTLPLATTFRAVVDGTHGDVQLEEVDARLASSRFVAKGFVVGTKGLKGKRILLDVHSEGARMEDVLQLTVRGPLPAMRGALTVTTSFDLPQGDRDVIDKLRLAGTVTIADARFTSDAAQDKVDALSRRARGRPGDTAIEDVPSTIRTEFEMADGTVRLRNLTYDVEGATVTMQGRYVLESGVLDFAGTARLRASVSDTQTGFRHFLLKPFDGVLRKRGAGTRLALKVTGTVDEPKVALDLGRTLRGR